MLFRLKKADNFHKLNKSFFSLTFCKKRKGKEGSKERKKEGRKEGRKKERNEGRKEGREGGREEGRKETFHTVAYVCTILDEVAFRLDAGGRAVRCLRRSGRTRVNAGDFLLVFAGPSLPTFDRQIYTPFYGSFSLSVSIYSKIFQWFAILTMISERCRTFGSFSQSRLIPVSPS